MAGPLTLSAHGSMTKPTRTSGNGSLATDPFLVLRENRLGFTAIERLAKRSARGAPSVVYLWGPPGTGKSHLVRHLLREIRQADSTLTVRSTTASGLAAEYAEASHRNQLAEWSEPWRSCDVLVCEDLQVIGRRPETQQVLVSWMDDVVGNGGRVLLTASRLPGEIPGLSSRLVSRCRGGVLAGLRMPDSPSRLALLTHFASSRQIAAPPDALKLLADARPASPRDLQAALNQMESTARVERARLDAEFVRRFLEGDVKRPPTTLPDVARVVARHFGLRMADLRSSTRQQELAIPRQCAMYLGRTLTEEPLARIATYFGRKNHTAVIHACRRTKASLSEEPELRHHLSQIRAALGATGDAEPGETDGD
jgi:chromosomal replication initiator protein